MRIETSCENFLALNTQKRKTDASFNTGAVVGVAGGFALAVVAGVAVAALPESVAGSIARATVDVAKLAVAKLIR